MWNAKMLLVGVLVPLLVACNVPPEAAANNVALANATHTWTSTPTPSTIPSATPSSTQMPTRTPTTTPEPPGCPFEARFVRDVTYPDNTVVRTGDGIHKTWELRNTSACDWVLGVTLHEVDEKGNWKLRSVSVPAVKAGEAFEISVNTVAPVKEGTHVERWRLRYGYQGFDPTITLVIRVVSPTPVPPPTVRPTARPTQPPVRGVIAPTRMPENLGYVCRDGTRCIKGNVSYTTGERIYHIPGCENYNDTVINTRYGERWFANEAEARAAGWRKAKNCP
jgi:hypothetical protein